MKPSDRIKLTNALEELLRCIVSNDCTTWKGTPISAGMFMDNFLISDEVTLPLGVIPVRELVQAISDLLDEYYETL